MPGRRANKAIIRQPLTMRSHGAAGEGAPRLVREGDGFPRGRGRHPGSHAKQASSLGGGRRTRHAGQRHQVRRPSTRRRPRLVLTGCSSGSVSGTWRCTTVTIRQPPAARDVRPRRCCSTACH